MAHVATDIEHDDIVVIDRPAAIASLIAALARVLTISLLDQPSDRGVQLSTALAKGEENLRIVIDMPPFVMTGFLKDENGAPKGDALFEIRVDEPVVH